MKGSWKIQIVIVAVLMAFSGIVSGQNESTTLNIGYPVYSQYLQNGLMINPAYAGTRGNLSAFASYRMQWMNMPGAPKIQSLSLHSPLKNDKVGLGVMAQFMSFASTMSTSIYADYAYHIRLKNGKLSFGLKAGFDRSGTNYADILKSLTDDGDPVFLANDKPYMLPNAGAGVYYYSNKVFAGVAVPAFLSYSRTSSGGTQAYHNFGNYDVVFSAGGLITFSQFFKFKPSVLIDYSLDKAEKLTQLDVNGNIILADILWLGGSYRTTEQVAVGIMQLQINPQLMIGASYDYAAGRMKTYRTGGSTEFIIRYEFGYKVSASNPRYF